MSALTPQQIVQELDRQIVGQHQAKLYANCLEQQFGRRPLIFYSNGYEHWLWDDARHPPRPVHGFLKKDELELWLQRQSSRKPLTATRIDEEIVGQRRGVRLALGYPVYVTGKDAATNTIRVGGRENLTSRGCTVGEANWLSDEVPDGTRCLAMYRYNSSPVAALVRRLDDAAGSTHSGRVGRFSVQFEEPQHAVAPGQAMVLYGEDDSVLGGGWIEATN